MLQHVLEYATRCELAAEPGFSPKDARWGILCDGSGEYLGLVELGDAGARRNSGLRFRKAPDLSQPEMKAGGITKSHFLIETAAVVANYGKEAPEEKHRYFVGLLEQAAKTMPSLGAAAGMLRSDAAITRLRGDMEAQRVKPTDKATFQIGGEFPVESEAWHEWWRGFRRSLAGGAPKRASGKMLCFLTGEAAEPAATHPKITGLTGVGGLAMGDVLIGFKQESFRSYGLEQSANAAMSELAAKAYQAGLNDLVANHSVTVAGAMVTHWFRGSVPEEDDPFPWLVDSGSEEAGARVRARKLLDGIRTGERADLANNTYYALTISSNGGRVVVRDWMEGSFEELAGNIDGWFSDLAIVQRYGSGLAKAPKFAAVLGGLVRDLKDVPAQMAARMFRVALRGEPIPFEALARALARAKIDVIKAEPANHARMGLIRAYHVRKGRKGGTKMEERLKPERNADFDDLAYQCGRLMAVLAKLQHSALGDVGAGVVQRYYAAASTTPKLVFGRLIRGAQPHIGKISAERKRLAICYEKEMREICGRIGKDMPVTLNLEGQSLFAMGYYQEQAALWAGKDGKEENNNEQAN